METPSLNYLKELSDGNPVFEKKIFKILMEELPLEFKSYQNELNKQNYFYAAEFVHKIKHKIAFFQMSAAFDIAEEHEFALMRGDLKYEKDFQEIITKILNFLPKHSE